MKVNIKRAIQSIKGDVDFFQPLYEAIVNSFQAEAENIEISFDVGANGIIKGYSVKDDGNGFTDENIESFLTLWSEYNISKGALGSGRILCLKVFDNIVIKSQVQDNKTKKGKLVNIDFNQNFTANVLSDINKSESSYADNYTITTFKNISKQEDKDKALEIDSIEEKIFIELLPLFIRFNKEKQQFSIKINDTLWINKEQLTEQLIKYSFEEKDFLIKGETFKLTYRIIKDSKNQLEQFYGASDRNITKFPTNTKIQKLNTGYSGIFCLTSSYLDDRVSDSRKEFTLSLNQNNPSDENPVLFKDINDELTKLLNDILRERFNDIDKQFTDKKNSIVEKLPHLAEYVKNIKNLTLPEAKMIEQAEKSFLSRRKEVKKEVETFIKKINVKDFNEQKFNEVKNDFTNVGKEILADYIGYRETLIAMLLEIRPENREKDIHNLFMPQYTSSSDGNKYANNVWIFDDKFMNYNYAASDQTIQKIANNVNGVATDVPSDEANIRPDLIMFYSDNENNYKDVLLIEFKKLGASIDNKEKAINQLNKYPMYIRDNVKKIGNIYAYTIIDLDDTFIKILKDVNGFVDNAFGDSEGKISAYYRYNPNIKAHINVVSFSQVLNDASKRNKVFLDILINKFKNENN